MRCVSVWAVGSGMSWFDWKRSSAIISFDSTGDSNPHFSIFSLPFPILNYLLTTSFPFRPFSVANNPLLTAMTYHSLLCLTLSLSPQGLNAFARGHRGSSASEGKTLTHTQTHIHTKRLWLYIVMHYLHPPISVFLLARVLMYVLYIQGSQAEGDNIEKTWWREWSNRQDSKMVPGKYWMYVAVDDATLRCTALHSAVLKCDSVEWLVLSRSLLVLTPDFPSVITSSSCLILWYLFVHHSTLPLHFIPSPFPSHSVYYTPSHTLDCTASNQIQAASRCQMRWYSNPSHTEAPWERTVRTSLPYVQEQVRPIWDNCSSIILSPHILLSCPVLSCPVLSCPVLSCPVLSCPVLTYSILSS